MDDPAITEVPGNDPALADALAEVRLPTDDLTELGRRFFRFSDDHGLIGFIGWEEAGDNVLLMHRSLP